MTGRPYACLVAVLFAVPLLAGQRPAVANGPGPQSSVFRDDPRVPFSFVARNAFQPFSAERLKMWMTVVREHEPGAWEPRTELLSMWTNGQLAGALKDFEAFRMALAGAAPRAALLPPVTGSEPPAVSFAGWSGTLAEGLELAGLTVDEAVTHDARRVYKRAAVLHTDIAVADMLEIANRDQARVARVASRHFGFAMALVEALAADSPRDPFVRQWYTCTAAFLQRRHEIDAAAPLLSRAVKRFPTDARLLLLAGAVHELLASPRIQGAVDFAASDIFTRDEHLGRAEKYFTGALAQDDHLVEARLRLGHVLLESRRYLEALAAFEPIQVLPDSTIAYFVHMFTGLAEEALGHDDAARAAYRQAQALYPGAKTPQLALSHPVHARGDRTAAFTELQPMMQPDGPRADPWENYFEAGHGELARALLSDLRAPFRKAGAR